MLLILFLYMLLASTFTLGKAVLVYTQPIFFIGFRMTVAGIILLTYSYVKSALWRFNRKDSLLFAQIILLHIYVAYVFEYVALEHVSSSKACLFYSLSPFLTALYSYLFFSERLTSRQWHGLALGFTGFLPVLLATAPSENSSLLWVSFSELLLLISVVASVQGWIVVKKLLKRGYSPTMINGIGMLCGGLLALITSYWFEDTFLKVYTSRADSLMMFFFYTFLLIIIANVIFYNLYGYLMHRYSATFLSFAGFTSPLFAALYGRLFLGEAIKPWFLLSVGIIGIGLSIFYQEELKRIKIV